MYWVKIIGAILAFLLPLAWALRELWVLKRDAAKSAGTAGSGGPSQAALPNGGGTGSACDPSSPSDFGASSAAPTGGDGAASNRTGASAPSLDAGVGPKAAANRAGCGR